MKVIQDDNRSALQLPKGYSPGAGPFNRKCQKQSLLQKLKFKMHLERQKSLDKTSRIADLLYTCK